MHTNALTHTHTHTHTHTQTRTHTDTHAHTHTHTHTYRHSTLVFEILWPRKLRWGTTRGFQFVAGVLAKAYRVKVAVVKRGDIVKRVAPPVKVDFHVLVWQHFRNGRHA